MGPSSAGEAATGVEGSRQRVWSECARCLRCRRLWIGPDVGRRSAVLANETKSVARCGEGETGDFEKEDHGEVSRALIPEFWRNCGRLQQVTLPSYYL